MSIILEMQENEKRKEFLENLKNYKKIEFKEKVLIKIKKEK